MYFTARALQSSLSEQSLLKNYGSTIIYCQRLLCSYELDTKLTVLTKLLAHNIKDQHFFLREQMNLVTVFLLFLPNCMHGLEGLTFQR